MAASLRQRCAANPCITEHSYGLQGLPMKEPQS